MYIGAILKRRRIPYSGNVWQGESLANHQQFTKLKPSKLVVTIDNLWADLFIRQALFHQNFYPPTLAKHHISPPNFLLYGTRDSLVKTEIATYV